MISPLFSPVSTGLALNGAAGDVFLARSLSPTHLDPLTGPDPFQSRFCSAEGGDGGSGSYREPAIDPDAVWSLMAGDLKKVQDAELGHAERLESLFHYANFAKRLPPGDERQAESAYQVLHHLRISAFWRNELGDDSKKGAIRDQWFREHDVAALITDLVAALPKESRWNTRLARELVSYRIPAEENEIRFLQTVMLGLLEERPDLLRHGARITLTRLMSDPRFLKSGDQWLEGFKEFGFFFISPLNWVFLVPLWVAIGVDASAPFLAAGGLLTFLGIGVSAGFAWSHARDLSKAGRPAIDPDDEAYEAIADDLAALRLRMEDDTEALRDRLEAMRAYAKTASRLPDRHQRLEEIAFRILETVHRLLERGSPGTQKILHQEWRDHPDDIASHIEDLLRRAPVQKSWDLDRATRYDHGYTRTWKKELGRLLKAYEARLEEPSPRNPSVPKVRVEEAEPKPRQGAGEEIRTKKRGRLRRKKGDDT